MDPCSQVLCVKSAYGNWILIIKDYRSPDHAILYQVKQILASDMKVLRLTVDWVDRNFNDIDLSCLESFSESWVIWINDEGQLEFMR